ncbi:MAG: D-glycero-beta-D-manno-heptose 1-phosphate adenylyltransferase [FCB group bacterium]|jgi:D-beta-D-heptose 7-phosphate kinase/D-beta-D-heptose 1-phosphate adenosyltransferase
MLLLKDEMALLCNDFRSQNKKIVFTNGCFDIIHAGHVSYLAEAKKHGNILIIGLNSDESVRRLKGRHRPINEETDRALVLSALRSVDYVCIFDEDTPLELIKLLKPDVLVKGGDYTEETIVGADFVKSTGGKVVIVPLVPGKSTTELLSRISLQM